MPSARLAGKVALVTGSTRGIGRAAALASAGASVAVCGRDTHAAETVVEDIRRAGARGVAVVADLGRDRDIDSVVPRTCAALASLDILVNNAGIDPFRPSLETPLGLWRRAHRINLEAPLRMSQAAAGRFGADGWVIINIASALGLIGLSEHAAYTASKHGLVGLTKVLALEWARRGIRVNAIAPGLVETELSREGWNSAAAADRVATSIPAGQVAQPEDVARLVVFLASDEARDTHGQVLAVDGGRLAR